MSLLKEVERILSNLTQEVEVEASVLVQFAAGDWEALRNAFNNEKGNNVAPVTIDSTATVDVAPEALVTEPVIEVPVVAEPVVAPIEAPVIEPVVEPTAEPVIETVVEPVETPVEPVVEAVPEASKSTLSDVFDKFTKN